MSPTPILSAIPILRTALFAAIAPLLTAYQDSAGRAKCYWQQADQKDANGTPITIPYIVVQSQDAGGAAVKYVGDHGWSGPVTLKALANGQQPADDLFAIAAPGMGLLAYADRSITASFERPLSIPPTPAGVWQAAGLWRITIH